MVTIGTKEVKDALWQQLETLRALKTKSKDEKEQALRESAEILKVTSQITEVLKVELGAMQVLTKQDGVKLGETTARHFGIIDKE